MSARARAAARLQEEAIPYVWPSPRRSTEALLEYGCEEPIDLLVPGVSSDPRDVTAVAEAERLVANLVIDGVFDDHEKVCEPCRRSGHSLGGAVTRGLARMTRVIAARRPVTWLALCPEGKQLFIASWIALGLGLPEYAR